MGSISDTISVLHVDDEPNFADMAATFLEREDERFAIETVNSADGGLDRLHDNEFDCIISDYDMPEMNGIEFLRTVRENHPDIPFILYTGKGSEEIASEAISAGVTDYLQKGSETSQYAVLANRILNAVEQHRARQEAEETQQRLREITENITDCVWMFDREWQKTVFISGYEDLWGRPKEALEENPQEFLDSIHPDDRAFVEESIERVLDGQPTDIEYRILKEDETRWVRVKRQPIFDNEGDVVRIAGFTRDITDRKEREHELERYETIVEALGDPIYALDADGCFTFVNEAFVEKIGYDHEELIGQHTSIMLSEMDVERGRNIIRDLLSTDDKRTATWEMTSITADGDRFLSENHLALLPSGDDGSFRGTAGVIRDISERKNRERMLRQLHAASRELLTADTKADVADIVVEAVRDTLGYTNNAVRLVSDDRSELCPVSLTEGITEILGERPVYPVGKGTAGRAFASQETLLYDDVQEINDGYDRGDARAGMYLPIGEHGTLSINDDDPGVFGETDVQLAETFAANAAVALDRIEQQQELQRQNEQLEKFAGIVSHDLQNPLHVAEGRLELAKAECDSEHLDDVSHAHDRMKALIDDLLTLAREGEAVGEFESVSLEELVENCWQAVDTADVTLDCEVERSIRADSNRLAQLLENLIRNAVKHGGDDVTVGVLDDGFYVEDNGPGISEADRDEVFEMGYSTSEEGTGFGLTIVKRIADAHGWNICVTEGANGGARFEITGVEFAE